ncbi:hypothetical protein ENBRE01_2028 [Enteropsectra breve]|nr:hypothetical protein ENBRE01_2028 [Enteropsectra breve]
MSPIDVYEQMLGTIQQFPLDANIFQREMKRIDCAYAHYLRKYNKAMKAYLKSHPKSGEISSKKNKQVSDAKRHEAYLKAKKKLEMCLSARRRATMAYLGCIGKQLGLMEGYMEIAGNIMEIKAPEYSGCMYLKISPHNETGNHCQCNGPAQGVMICCENLKCPVRWYHLKCVELVSIPKDRWICSACKSV